MRIILLLFATALACLGQTTPFVWEEECPLEHYVQQHHPDFLTTAEEFRLGALLDSDRDSRSLVEEWSMDTNPDFKHNQAALYKFDVKVSPDKATVWVHIYLWRIAHHCHSELHFFWREVIDPHLEMWVNWTPDPHLTTENMGPWEAYGHMLWTGESELRNIAGDDPWGDRRSLAAFTDIEPTTYKRILPGTWIHQIHDWDTRCLVQYTFRFEQINHPMAARLDPEATALAKGAGVLFSWSARTWEFPHSEYFLHMEKHRTEGDAHVKNMVEGIFPAN